MNKEIKPENFDWVTARSACSANKIFEKLKMQVQQNVVKRKEFFPPKNYYTFDFIESGSASFSVAAAGHHIHDSVRFQLSGEKISVRSIDGAEHELYATLCNDGECRLKMKGQEYDLWQVLKMFLEDLFFKKYDAN